MCCKTGTRICVVTHKCVVKQVHEAGLGGDCRVGGEGERADAASRLPHRGRHAHGLSLSPSISLLQTNAHTHSLALSLSFFLSLLLARGLATPHSR